MTPSETDEGRLRVKLAELCGWTNVRRTEVLKGRILREDVWGCPPEWEKNGYTKNEVIPDYCHDLNATAEVEAHLNRGQRLMYLNHLDHPDPIINAEVEAEAIQNEKTDLAAGYSPSWWTCPECSHSHHRGHFGVIGSHRCLKCGYAGGGGVMSHHQPDPNLKAEPATLGREG